MNKIIVVEGKSDTRRLNEVYPGIVTFETSGLGIDADKIDKLKKLAIDHEIIVFTDPDGPGEIIRQRIIDNIDNIKHAYIKNDKAVSKNKKKVGIEHASDEEIKLALENIYMYVEGPKLYDMDVLIEFGIYNNKHKRNELCDYLHIAYGNNKKVLKQLNHFAISIDKIKQFNEEYNDKA